VTVPLVCFTGDGRRTLEGRMSLILDAEERMTGYVFTFDDRTEDLAALGRRDSLLREATEGLQGQVAILRAAAETLVGHPEMEAASRTAFLDAVATESRRLSERLALLTADFRAVVSGHWPMADVDSSNLLACVARRLKEETAIRATVTGIPQWLRGDSHSLVELLDHLVRRLAETARVAEFDLAAEAGERKVYLDVIWRGEPVAAAVLDSWLNVRLEGVGGLTARDVVEHHRTDVWSQPHRDGHARLRMPVPPGLQAQQAAAADRRQLPPRPEFYDFDLLRQPAHPGRLGERRLRELTYVVFDTETTGLEPEKGDEVISIAGVRVVNGRILTGESFDRLVNPGREIPRSSIRFHGITDDMVRDKPPLAVVLPQFKDFAGDAILVGHNAAFDLKFLRLKEEATGIRLDNSVLDTLILAVALGERTPEHSLDALAAQFGIEVDGRHTALGDSLATAAVLLRLIDLMGECGIHTLDDALAASAKAMAQMGVGET
jgi:DNA polymerase-3 subunit epsilon